MEEILRLYNICDEFYSIGEDIPEEYWEQLRNAINNAN